MKPKVILVVDDDVDVLTIMDTILSNEGYKVLTATNKAEAIKKIQEGKPDLILLDVMMDTIYEGFELAEMLKNDPGLKKIPVLIQTSMDVFDSSIPEDIELARQYRSSFKDKDLEVFFVSNTATGEAGIDYRTEDGQIKWIPVEGFIRKPITASALLPEVEKHIKN